MSDKSQSLSHEEEVQRLLKARDLSEENETREETKPQSEQVAARGHAQTDKASDKSHQKTDQAADNVQDMAENWREGVHRKADQGHQVADKVAGTIQNAAERGRETVHTKVEDARNRAHETQHKGQGKMEDMKAQAQHAGAQAHTKADSTMTTTGQRIESAARTVRDKSPQGQMGRVAGRAADTMEQSGRYLQQSSPDDVRFDVEQLIRKHPAEALLIGTGIGFLFERMTHRR